MAEYCNNLNYPSSNDIPLPDKKENPKAYFDAVDEYHRKVMEYVTGPVFKAGRQAYFNQERMLEESFRKDLEEQHGMTNNRKANLLYAKAKAAGYVNGFEGIAMHYANLVEILN